MISQSDILKADILIVDDQEDNVSLMSDLLRGAGYLSISSTRDPLSVAELYRKHRYAIILLDLEMPAFDGFRVMEALKAIETEGYLPVLVITGYPDHRLQALKAGARDFVTRPFDAGEVLTRIHHMIEVRLLSLHVEKQAEAVRQMSEARLNFVLQRSHIGAWEMALPERTINRTPIYDAIFGHDRLLPYWSYELFLEHVLAEDREAVDRSFREATEGIRNWNCECRIRRADDGVRWISLAGSHERDAEGNVVRLSGIVQDITQQKRADQENQNQLRELLRWQEALIGREERVLELKQEVNELLAQYDLPARYAPSTTP